MRGITLIAGYPEYDGTRIFNSAIVIRDGVVLANHRKACLPELPRIRREALFHPGTDPTVVAIERRQGGDSGVRRRVGPRARGCRRARAGAEVLLVINASPYEVNKQTQREARGRARARRRDGDSAGVRQSDRRPG